MAEFNWKGRDVRELIRAAQAEALEETAVACVRDAHPNTPIRTGTLRGSIRFQPVEETEQGMFVEWGSYGVNYAIYVELGTGRRNGVFMLRNAADREYPKLASRIRNRLRGKLG